jgi:uncharacterized protein (DUF2126 family)/transglutaminase-like putative cysteine protease
VAIHVALSHITSYRYDRLVALGPQLIRLRPAPHCRTPILSYSLKVTPSQHFLNWQQDPFANYLARVVVPDRTRDFTVTVSLVAEMAVYNPFDFFLEPSAEEFPFRYEPQLAQELAPYLVKDEVAGASPKFKSYLRSIDTKRCQTTNFVVRLNQQLQGDVSYLIRMEPGVQTPEQTLTLAAGSCRDSAWLLVQILRHLGLAARFVSGYLLQLKADVKSLDGPSGASSDFTDLHAWCEVYLPGAGWIGLDPTSGLLAGEGHIPLAATPEPSSAAPISGGVDQAEVEFGHVMEIQRIYESPRVTFPYTESTWQDINQVGEQVDRELEAMDVRLTMGGEPTFVSVDDRDGAEWNTSALGETKRGLSTELLMRLAEHYGKGGFLHFGQGKWYPGEQLPRWALSVFWRADGVPVWKNPALFADERKPAAYTTEDAERFVKRLAETIGVTAHHHLPAYEDTYYYLWRERRLPVNVDPLDPRLDDAQERERLRRVFAQGLGKVVGYVLPLARNTKGGGFHSGPWFLRDANLLLLPGDSPMGYRLPLDALPWTAEEDRELVIAEDPFVPAATTVSEVMSTPQRQQSPAHGLGFGAAGLAYVGGALPIDSDKTPAAPATPDIVPSTPPARLQSAARYVRTALCVEVRAGHLYVFLPPVRDLEGFLELLSAIEATAAALNVSIVLEGYAPPRDARMKSLSVTPDPGVIEVNIHPSSSWKELVEHTEFLYQTAFETRLSTEKFMIDGRHSGTGGGNHFVLGAAHPPDSPFLRRPDLLASLLAYWHNHPSLSYLFSGLFIGPTSQAPRVDEARMDQLYELEIALEQIRLQVEETGNDVAPWVIDRALRNILVDVTGNTHRAEFCIDKLYSPDGPTGRLGLLELRAFEMPPHARMSLAQQLLLRALIARFWRQPYRAPLVRWGTALHDRFLLPSYVEMDFDDVMTELNSAGFAFDAAWFAPHFEFRFPFIGEVAAQGVHLTLRAALEPWNVLGEESTGQGTVRYVDSSLERLEIRVKGLIDRRHVVAVNGEAVPLQPTGRAGEYVAGVRYKAWAPGSALHPNIGIHVPLKFDIVDTWNHRSIAGCSYYVAHPAGRNYETFPINAYEAESRRLARFTRLTHTAGPMEVAYSRVPPEFPYSIDLRQSKL